MVMLTMLTTGMKAAPYEFAHRGRATGYMMIIPPRIDKLYFIRLKHDINTLSALSIHNNAPDFQHY